MRYAARMARLTDEHRERFILWLCTPPAERDPRTQDALAQEFGYKPGASVLTQLKSDPEFLREWNTRYLQTISSPDKKMRIMERLEQTALDEDDPKHVQAARTYLDIVESMSPRGPGGSTASEPVKPASDLSDEALEALLSKGARDELAERRELKEAAGE